MPVTLPALAIPTATTVTVAAPSNLTTAERVALAAAAATQNARDFEKRIQRAEDAYTAAQREANSCHASYEITHYDARTGIANIRHTGGDVENNEVYCVHVNSGYCTCPQSRLRVPGFNRDLEAAGYPPMVRCKHSAICVVKQMEGVF